MRSRHGSHAVVAMLLLAGGCGGGGSSGSSGPDPIAITFSPSPLTTAFNQGDFVLPVTLNVTLSRLPQGTIFVVLGLDQPVLSNTTLIVSQVGPTTFSVPLTPSCTLAPGSHAPLRACPREQRCGSNRGPKRGISPKQRFAARLVDRLFHQSQPAGCPGKRD